MEQCWMCGRTEDQIELMLVVCTCSEHIDCGASRGEYICIECAEQLEEDFEIN